ncbi:MAG: hypothetical protein V7672_00735 [Brevundimonas sp.]|uniref:hypothetical protein n=1 Tax=Brevundimonas sp. TaxID=1871086 RepID=UPI0030023FDF
MTWTEIGNVESVGEFGSEAATVAFTPLATGLTRQLKGAKNPGGITINCGNDPLDAGQLAAITAAGTNSLYPLKIVDADGADSNDTDSTVYIGVRIMSAKKNSGQTGAVNMRAINCVIDTPVYEDPSEAVS